MENQQRLIMDPDTKKTIRQQYSQMTTFRGKFQVAWKLSGPGIIKNYHKIIKTVSESTYWKRTGNKEYTSAKNKDYLRKSIEAYTKSIACAPDRSRELSLAYANRSDLLFKARLYEDCLLDIEHSLKTDYPDKLKTQLYARQALCFEALKPSSYIERSVSMANATQWLPASMTGNRSTYNLSKEYAKMKKKLKEPRSTIKFIPEIKNNNAVIVGASDAIELKKTNDNNQHVVATRNIESGEFIYISEPFAATPADDLRFTNCWHCCCQTWASIPCEHCVAVIYCSDNCKGKAWDSYHKIECPVSEHYSTFNKILPSCSSAIKLFSKTLNSVGGLIELKKKIDDIDSMQKSGLIYTDGILDVNTMDNFFNLDYFNATPNECSYGLASFVVKIVAIFGQKTDILGKKMTQEELLHYMNEKFLILGELLLRFVLIDSRHGQSLSVDDSVKWSQVMLPFWNILKPSCDPNVNWTHVGSNVGYYATKPIKQGEPIFSRRCVNYHETSKTDRYIKFKELSSGPVSCECRACVENWPVLEDLSVYSPPESMPTWIETELKYMTLELGEWKLIINQRDPKKFLTIKDNLNRMNDLLHQYVTVPCKEISVVYLLLEKLYTRLHSVHDIDE